jgi:lysozyme family protein
MADYKHAILKVLLTEGGYANDADDSGGETYKGISRANWPQWAGWKLIDQAKKQAGWSAANLERSRVLSKVPGLKDLVIAFYKTNFWNPIGGDFIKDQDFADKIVDAAVNEGVKGGVRHAQKILHLQETGVINNELVKRLNSMV